MIVEKEIIIMNRDELFKAVETKFDVEEVVAVIFGDHSGSFRPIKGCDVIDEDLMSFSDFDTLTVEQIEICEQDAEGYYWAN